MGNRMILLCKWTEDIQGIHRCTEKVQTIKILQHRKYIIQKVD